MALYCLSLLYTQVHIIQSFKFTRKEIVDRSMMGSNMSSSNEKGSLYDPNYVVYVHIVNRCDLTENLTMKCNSCQIIMFLAMHTLYILGKLAFICLLMSCYNFYIWSSMYFVCTSENILDSPPYFDIITNWIKITFKLHKIGVKIRGMKWSYKVGQILRFFKFLFSFKNMSKISSLNSVVCLNSRICSPTIQRHKIGPEIRLQIQMH